MQPENDPLQPNDAPNNPVSPALPDQTPLPPAAVQATPVEPLAITPSQPSPIAPDQPEPVVTQSSQPMPGVVRSPGRARSRWPLVATLIVVVCLLLAGGAFAYFKLQAPTPDKAFNTALANALSTSSVTQKSTAKSLALTIDATIKYDLSNVKDPRVDTALTMTSGDTLVQFQGYGTLKNTYFKLAKFQGEDPVPAAQTNVWVQITKNGTTPDDATLTGTMAHLYDPHYAALGQYIFGNFNDKDSAALQKYALDQHVYDYKQADVKKAKLGDQQVYEYTVNISKNSLVAYNRKVAAVMGISGAGLESSLSLLNDLHATMYVSVKNSQLIKVETDDGQTTVYSDWNKTSLPKEPTPAMQYDDFLSQSSSATTPDDNSSVQAKANDSQRKTDIMALDSHLEAYYAENGNYPTLAQMNDAGWVKANMSGLDPAALQDPDATSASPAFAATPRSHQYAYQVGSDSNFTDCTQNASNCSYFRLTAILSDGSSYTKESIN